MSVSLATAPTKQEVPCRKRYFLSVTFRSYPLYSLQGHRDLNLCASLGLWQQTGWVEKENSCLERQVKVSYQRPDQEDGREREAGVILGRGTCEALQNQETKRKDVEASTLQVDSFDTRIPVANWKDQFLYTDRKGQWPVIAERAKWSNGKRCPPLARAKAEFLLAQWTWNRNGAIYLYWTTWQCRY